MTQPLLFACDAMLGGLARWLRAAGYDAAWGADIDDWDLIRLARRESRVLLTSDTGIFKIGIVRDGDVPALFIPHGLSKLEQLTFVMQKLNLSRRDPRCMACGGDLVAVAKEQVRDRAPPRSYAWLDRFYECRRCGRLFWEGTHWQRIVQILEKMTLAGMRSESKGALPIMAQGSNYPAGGSPMPETLRVETTVLPGNRIEISAPQLAEGTKVEVIISPKAVTSRFSSAWEFLQSLPPGPRAFKTWEEYERHLQQERDSWDR